MLAGGSADDLVGWPSVSKCNCYTDEQGGHFGADIISHASNPFTSYMTVAECQDACVKEPRCDGISMQEAEEKDVTCWLRHKIDIANCSSAWAAFTTWLKPHGEWRAPMPEAIAKSYLGVSCPSPDWTELERHDGLSLNACERRCYLSGQCIALHFQHLPLGSAGYRGPTCRLGVLTSTSRCAADSPGFELRVLKPVVPASTTLAPVAPMAPMDLVAWPLGSGWPSFSSTNCDAGRGGAIVSPSVDPVHGHQLLHSCRSVCEANADCEGFVFRETKDVSSNNCYLRKAFDLGACEKVEGYNVWMNPARLARDAGPRAPAGTTWTSHGGKNCYPGHGAERATAQQDAVPGRLSIAACEAACVSTEGCQGIVWQETADVNCYLRKDIEMGRCDSDPQFEMRVMYRPSKPWQVLSGVNCFAGHGAEPLDLGGFDPLPAHVELQACQALCEERRECGGVVMQSSAAGSNCWLRKSVRAQECLPNPLWTAWVKPSSVLPEPAEWVTYPGLNCYEGMGADEVANADDHPRYVDLGDCEIMCERSEQCEAVVWRREADAVQANCRLLKHVDRRSCAKKEAYTLRVRRSFIQMFSLPPEGGAHAQRLAGPWSWAAAGVAACALAVGVAWRRSDRGVYEALLREPRLRDQRFHEPPADVADGC